MRIAITGEKGFIGLHLTAYLRDVLKYEVIELGKDYLSVLNSIKKIDWLIHGACFHRHENQDVLFELNRNLTIDTIRCLTSNDSKCNIMHLSSIQEENKTAYGRSKRETNKLLSDYCQSVKKEFISLKLPNVFGKNAVPYKTSFIATFCFNLHNNVQIEYNSNEVKVISIEKVIPLIAKFKLVEIPFDISTVEKIYDLLKTYHELRIIGKTPILLNEFEKDLHHTYWSYLNYKL